MARPRRGSSKSKVGVSGLKELEQSLITLQKATAKNTLRRVLKKSHGPMTDDMAANAPELTGALEESVKYTTKPPKNHQPGTAAFSAAKKVGASSKIAGKLKAAANRLGLPWVEGFIGPGRNPQAIQQEFGNELHEAQPFARPAWDSGKSSLLRRVTKNLTIEVKKSVKRAEKKAAKAKGKPK